MRHTVWLALALLGANTAHAQSAPGWTPSAADCQRAADSLTAGSRNARAWGFISSCGATGATALATAIRNVRSGSVVDTTYLTKVLAAARRVQAGAVLDEAIALAESKTSPPAARAFALMIMLAQHQPTAEMRGEGWSTLLTVPRGAYCRLSYGGGGSYNTMLAMPADYLQRIASSADRVADDPADSPVARGLARCVRLTLRQKVPETVAPELLQLEYVCGTKFRARNAAAKPAQLRYEVEGTTETGAVVVPASASAAFITENTGTVRLFQNATLIASAPNDGTQCS
jgi:hypothetical protein